MAYSKFTEDVNGAVIGAITNPYQFWSKGEFKEQIWKGHYESDEEAVADFKHRFPNEFKQGVEMRVYE